jgi:hypothetical protein
VFDESKKCSGQLLGNVGPRSPWVGRMMPELEPGSPGFLPICRKRGTFIGQCMCCASPDDRLWMDDVNWEGSCGFDDRKTVFMSCKAKAFHVPGFLGRLGCLENGSSRLRDRARTVHLHCLDLRASAPVCRPSIIHPRHRSCSAIPSMQPSPLSFSSL